MEITPEDYLPVEALELHGPSAIEPKPPADAPAANDIFSVQERLFKAEASGDHLAIHRLSIQLDDMLAAVPNQGAEESSSEAPEGPSEVDEIDVRQSDLYLQINDAVGQEKADNVHSWMNENLSEDEVSDYLTQLTEGNQEAIQAFQAAQQAMDQGVGLDSDDPTSIPDAEQEQLVDHFGDNGQKLVEMNKALMAGSASITDLKRLVMSDPSLLADAFKAKAMNLISF